MPFLRCMAIAAILLLFACPSPTLPSPVSAPPNPLSPEVVDRIREEGQGRSQAMTLLSTLTDDIGPRLTGSPAARRANEWTRGKLADWGLADAHLEAWGPFGRGWTLQRFSLQAVEPDSIPLVAYPMAWSPGWKGVRTGRLVWVNATDEAGLAAYRGRLKSAFVMASPLIPVQPHFEAAAHRISDDQLREIVAAPADTGPSESAGQAEAQAAQDRVRKARTDFDVKRNRFFRQEGVAALIYPSYPADSGVLSAEAAFVSQPYDPVGKHRLHPWDADVSGVLPQVVVEREQYNRLVRRAQAGISQKAAMELDVRFTGGDLMAYNTVAEIPGSDLKDEIVMIGAHLDSWHAGTGATDDGAGVVACMEAVRILQAVGAKPRRTIRVGFWTGEEQGTLGSWAYVNRHFGSIDSPVTGKPAASGDSSRRVRKGEEYDRLSAYFHFDSGAGRVRGVFLDGNEAARPLLQAWMAPLKDLGVTALAPSEPVGSDHNSFTAVGLPAFMFIQDDLDYFTLAHHTSQDLYDRVQEDDLKQMAVTVATLAYSAAMAPDKLPRMPLRP